MSQNNSKDSSLSLRFGPEKSGIELIASQINITDGL